MTFLNFLNLLGIQAIFLCIQTRVTVLYSVSKRLIAYFTPEKSLCLFTQGQLQIITKQQFEIITNSIKLNTRGLHKQSLSANVWCHLLFLYVWPKLILSNKSK